ncbi:hypothetical protein [Halorhabdus amylolytica]|uniref:hypothetical protein n=1 Tax=Halorhabdus amylolytica TaxID=2559573 RepID=UPI0010AA2526|nr:hypothetical protein [Halorhabdus amylolytica]
MKLSRRRTIQLTGTALATTLGTTSIAAGKQINSPNYEGFAYNPKSGHILGEVTADIDKKSDQIKGTLMFPQGAFSTVMNSSIKISARKTKQEIDSDEQSASEYQAIQEIDITESSQNIIKKNEIKEDINELFNIRLKIMCTNSNITGYVSTPKRNRIAYIMVDEKSELTMNDLETALNKMGGEEQ